MSSESKVREGISSFQCEVNQDVKGFLDNKAIPFEQLSKSKTYFLMDAEQFASKNFVLLAYFTIALRVFNVSDLDLSNRAIKVLDGFSAKKDGVIITDLPVYLIGQIAKNDTYKSDIQGGDVVDRAVKVIKSAQKIVGGRIIMLECENVPHLIKFYESNGFSIISEDTDKYIQMIRLIV